MKLSKTIFIILLVSLGFIAYNALVKHQQTLEQQAKDKANENALIEAGFQVIKNAPSAEKNQTNKREVNSEKRSGCLTCGSIKGGSD